MAAPKGHPKYPGAGRAKGTPNKVTLRAKEVLSRAIDNLSPDFERWVRETAAGVPLLDENGNQRLSESGEPRWLIRPDRKAAAALYTAAAEYCVPKLSRSELTGGGGENLSIVFANVGPPGPREPGK